MKSSNKPSERVLQDLNAELAYAVKNNDIKSVKQALAAGASVETWSKIDRRRESVLYRAVTNGNLEIAELLLLQGADPNSDHSDRGVAVHRYPLHKATSDKNCKMMKLLLDFGANIEVVDDQKRTPMMIARSHYFSAECRAVFIDYLAEKRDPAQCYFNRGKKVAIAAIDRGLSGCDINEVNIGFAKNLKIRCQKTTSIGGLVQLIKSHIKLNANRKDCGNKDHQIIAQLQLREVLISLKQLQKLEKSKAVILEKKPDSDPVSTEKPTCVSSTSEVNKILSVVPNQPSAPLASSVESEELTKALKESKADQPESSSVYPKLFEVSASSVAVKTETRSADLQKSASCKF